MSRLVPDRATAFLALLEANKALKMAYDALRRLGAREQATEVRELADDAFALMDEVRRGDVELAPEVLS